MPSRSEAQRRALYAKFGKAWVETHHFDRIEKSAPDPKPKKRKKKR